MKLGGANKIRGLFLVMMVAWMMLTPAGTARAAGSNQGFLYGTVETSNGKQHEGIIRWGKEEAFWGDFFNSAKEELSYLDRQPDDQRVQRKWIDVFGRKIGYEWSGDASRQFVARFGDIAEIEPRRGDAAIVTMKNGRKYRVDGASNDVGADLTIREKELGEVTIPWEKIESIRFAPVPEGIDPGVTRLYGALKTREFTFEGFIQWDSEECLSTDILSGESEDERLSIAMGKIQSIARSGRNRSDVTLKDGRSFEMSGTNDVNSSIRGIFVEDFRLGRVKVSWDAFERLDFKVAPNSGAAYGDFKPAQPLRGRVTDRQGKTHVGILIFDLDEEETWEILNGDSDDVEYNIPFELVKSVEPRRRGSSLVTLKNGSDLLLEDAQDVSERNAGVLIQVSSRDKGTYVAWDEITRIDFE